MTEEEILAEFRSCDALLEGHFLLSSGKHSGHYLQCARILMNAQRAGRIALAIAKQMPSEIKAAVDLVVSPAMGGLIIGHEMGRVLSKDAVFLERPDGEFHLRRGFTIPNDSRVLMVEDVVTTGLSSREAIEAVRKEGGKVIGEVSVVDRSGGAIDLGVPFFPLISLNFPTYDNHNVPDSLNAIPITKPGSRIA